MAPTLVVTVILVSSLPPGASASLRVQVRCWDCAGPAGAGECRNRQACGRRLRDGHSCRSTANSHVCDRHGVSDSCRAALILLVGCALFAMARSIPDVERGRRGRRGNRCWAVLLAGFGSPPPDTTALFVNVPGATLAPTFVVTVILGSSPRGRARRFECRSCWDCAGPAGARERRNRQARRRRLGDGHRAARRRVPTFVDRHGVSDGLPGDGTARAVHLRNGEVDS